MSWCAHCGTIRARRRRLALLLGEIAALGLAWVFLLRPR
jgi:hypothetical protein